MRGKRGNTTPPAQQLHPARPPASSASHLNSALFETASGAQQSRDQGTVCNNVAALSVTRICAITFTQGSTSFH